MPEAGWSVAKPTDRWRAPTNRSRKRALGSTCRWKALWAEEAAPFDEEAVEAVLGSSTKLGLTAGRDRGATESVRGRSPASHAVENAAARWNRHRAVPSSSDPATDGGASGRADRSWRRGVNRVPLEVGAPQGGPASQPQSSSRSVLPEADSSAKAARSGIGRFTGARVESWMQRSARSIFLTRSRGAERRAGKT